MEGEKSLKIVILLAIGVVIALSIYVYSLFSNISVLKERNKVLNNDIKIIKIERDSLKKERKVLIKSIDSVNVLMSNEKEYISTLNSKISILETELVKSKADLNSWIYRYNQIDKKIKDLETKPVLREGDVLINSLKEKLK